MPKPGTRALDWSLAEIADRAREAERREIARELHDTVIQPLSALVTSVECMSRQPASEGTLEAYLGAWRELAQEAIDSLRQTLVGLHIHPHAQLGLPGALRRFLVPQARSHGLQFTVECDAWPDDLPADWTTSLYLAVREAVTNVQKHARASEVTVLLAADADRLHITVADNGVGFQLSELDTRQPRPAGDGFGISGMLDRLLMLDGHLTVITAPGHGTRLEMYAPRPSAASLDHGNALTTATGSASRSASSEPDVPSSAEPAMHGQQ